MTRCSDECVPICNHCKYCIHELVVFDFGSLKGEPIGCKLENHEVSLAGYCEDFYCDLAK